MSKKLRINFTGPSITERSWTRLEAILSNEHAPIYGTTGNMTGKKVSETVVQNLIPLELSTKWTQPQWCTKSVPRSRVTSTAIRTSIIAFPLSHKVSHECPNVRPVHMTHIRTLTWHFVGQWKCDYRRSNGRARNTTSRRRYVAPLRIRSLGGKF